MTPISYSFHDIGGGHALAMQTVGNPNGIKILMLHGGPGYYWVGDNLVLLHDALAKAGYNVCLQGLSQRGCGIGQAVSRTPDLLDDSMLKRAQDLKHLPTPDILLGHSTGAMVALTAMLEQTCQPRALALISPYTASLGEHDYWVTTKAEKYPRAFGLLHDFVAEQWEKYKGPVPADLREKLYIYWGQLFFALPDKDLQVKAKLYYLNFHVIDALPAVGEIDGEPYLVHYDMLKKWPDLGDVVMETLWRIGTISANWWQSNYQHGYPLLDKLKTQQITTPMHILSGLNDEITPPHTVQALADILGITPKFVPNCGHLAEPNVQGRLDEELVVFLGEMCRELL